MCVLIRTPYNQSACIVLTIQIFIKIASVIILIPLMKLNLKMLLFRYLNYIIN